jgi:hypothetical protein
MYASPVSLLRLPPPRRRVNQGKFAPAEVFFAPADVYFAPNAPNLICTVLLLTLNTK